MAVQPKNTHPFLSGNSGKSLSFKHWLQILKSHRILDMQSANGFKRITPVSSGSSAEIPEIALLFRGHPHVMSQKADICRLPHFCPLLDTSNFPLWHFSRLLVTVTVTFSEKMTVLSSMEMNNSIQWKSAETSVHKQLIKRELVSHVMSRRCINLSLSPETMTSTLGWILSRYFALRFRDKLELSCVWSFVFFFNVGLLDFPLTAMLYLCARLKTDYVE